MGINTVKKLQKGDTIGVIIASSYNKADHFEKLEKIINEMGFKLKYGKTVFLKHGYLAGSDEERINDIHKMFLDNEVSAILCLKGGFGATRIIDKLDYEVIKKHPKLLIGFSDVTALLNNLYKYCNFPTVHGLVGNFLASNSCDEFSKNDFKELLQENTKGRVLKGNEKTQTLIGGTVEGEIVGGNLCLISDMYGTDYEVDFEDKIVLIEEVDERPYNIDRMFAQFRIGKSLEKAKGFIFGHFTDCEDESGDNDYESLIKEYFGNLNVPIIYNFPTGHEFPFVNVPIGLKVRLNADEKKIEILEEMYHE